MSIKKGQFGLIILGVLLINLASAHEQRLVCAGGQSDSNAFCATQADSLFFEVGFVNEPAWATDSNGVNINISWFPDQTHSDASLQNVDTSANDKVVLDTVKAMYFGSESKYQRGMMPKLSTIIYSNGVSHPVVSQNPPDANGNIALKYGTQNVYNAYYRPTKAGVYGFVIKGVIDHINPLDNTHHYFDFSKEGLTFICGVNGTQDDKNLPPTKFGCVKSEIALPSEGSGE